MQWGSCWAPDAVWDLGRGRLVEGREAILQLWYGAVAGFAHKHLFQPLADAQARRATMTKEITARLMDPFQKLTKEERDAKKECRRYATARSTRPFSLPRAGAHGRGA